MGTSPHHGMVIRLLLILLATMVLGQDDWVMASDKPRVIVTTDGEIDDECSMVRFLLYANEFDVEGIITSSSQYHWQGHKWAGDDWMRPRLCEEALRLGRILAELTPDQSEVHGLVALMEIQTSRFAARTGADGEPVLLPGRAAICR